MENAGEPGVFRSFFHCQFLSNHRGDLAEQFVSAPCSDFFLAHRGHGHLPAGRALFYAVLDLDVEIGECLFQAAVHLTFALVMLTETYLHV